MPYKDPGKAKASKRAYYQSHKDKWTTSNKKAKSEQRGKYAPGYYSQNREKILRAVRKSRLKINYGLTEDAFNAMLAGQGGVCPICKTSDWAGPHKIPVVDHDHKAGTIRGILCQRCNMAMGLLGDDQDTVERMLNYLLRKDILVPGGTFALGYFAGK